MVNRLLDLKMKKNGFLRVVEATIGVLAILGALLIISSQMRVEEERDFTEILPPILNEIAHNISLRRDIRVGAPEISDKLDAFVKNRIKNNALNYSIKICDLDGPCALGAFPDNTGRDIFVSERVIAASIGESTFNPKKVKIFLWKKSPLN